MSMLVTRFAGNMKIALAGAANGPLKTMGLAKFLNFTRLAISLFKRLCTSRPHKAFFKVSKFRFVCLLNK